LLGDDEAKTRYDAYFDKIWCQTSEKASENGIELPSDERTNRRVSRPPAVLAACYRHYYRDSIG